MKKSNLLLSIGLVSLIGLGCLSVNDSNVVKAEQEHILSYEFENYDEYIANMQGSFQLFYTADVDFYFSFSDLYSSFVLDHIVLDFQLNSCYFYYSGGKINWFNPVSWKFTLNTEYNPQLFNVQWKLQSAGSTTNNMILFLQYYNIDTGIMSTAYTNTVGCPVAISARTITSNLNYQLDSTLEIIQDCYGYLTDVAYIRYSQGYTAGAEFAYTSGYDNGYDEGYQTGYAEGLGDVDGNGYFAIILFNSIFSIALLPVALFVNMLNFDILGVNVGLFVTALFTVLLVIFITRKILGGSKNE